MIEWMTPYNHDLKARSNEFSYVETQPSLTVQEHALDADINVIVKRFGLTGVMPMNHRMPEYGDYDNITDFRQAMDAVVSAAEHFNEMPWEVRAQFHNNPQEFLEFCEDGRNLDKARELGLAIKPAKADTTLADVNATLNTLVEVSRGSSSSGGAQATVGGADRSGGEGAR